MRAFNIKMRFGRSFQEWNMKFASQTGYGDGEIIPKFTLFSANWYILNNQKINGIGTKMFLGKCQCFQILILSEVMRAFDICRKL